MKEFVDTEPLDDEDELLDEEDESEDDSEDEEITVEEAIADGLYLLCDTIESFEKTLRQVNKQEINALSSLMEAVEENTAEIRNNLSVAGLMGKGKTAVDLVQRLMAFRNATKGQQNPEA